MDVVVWRCLLVFFVITGVTSSEDLGTQQFFDGFPDDVWDSLETEDVVSIVSQFIEELSSLDSLTPRDLNPPLLEANDERSKVFCEACHLAVGRLIGAYVNGTSLDVLFNRTVDLCINLNISSPMFCEQMIETSKPQVSWIITHSNLTAKDVCGVLFVGQDCKSDNPEREWQIDLPSNEKPPLKNITIAPGSPTLKVLHLADTHFDPYYKPGSNAVCDEIFFCCREESGPVKAPEDAAGFWGDYRACDLPKWTIEAIYEHILAEHPDISFIIWTGDLVPHDVWNTSREGNLNIIRESVATVAQYFPSIPVFPALGNHESDPVNAFSQPYIDNEFSMDWLYGEVASLWQTWLPEDVATTIAYSGYYIVDVFPDLRLISVNTNYCYNYNWWLLYDSVDPGEVLKWMAGELQRAEDDGVYVYLISHIPSGNDCHYTWSREYSKIVSRYEGVIAGIFYGHTHNDQFQMFFDYDNPSRPIEVGFVAQSQTTYSDLNSGYKIYTIDGGHENSTYTVLDHENWYFDLDRANFEMVPTFEILYSAKDAYGMPDLSPQSHLDLIYEMAQNNSATFDLFYRNYVKAGRPRMEEGCDEDCKSDLLCRLLVADTSDRSICKQVL
ncbi:sphingomyelin phosphodiesterase [Hyalella azteca]|uniref:Sphingomyelin phosphodiesterase n=1 Tax=Hyalella azteca TaxID=294128 RepID=A0A8B7N882_HYAAZ|nr:sphingomyelin phosphodiesterase [Hyalella azteca]